MKAGEFHWTNGWSFARNEDGSVRVVKRESAQSDAPIVVEATIPPLEWVSIVAHVAGYYEKVNMPVVLIACKNCPFWKHMHWDDGSGNLINPNCAGWEPI